tara:strand:- start:418 stop:705 length:288 start_codon:yes stop_codon:yes gene_type:complete
MFGNSKFRWFLLAPIVLTLLAVTSPASANDLLIPDEFKDGIKVTPEIKEFADNFSPSPEIKEFAGNLSPSQWLVECVENARSSSAIEQCRNLLQE